MNTLQQKEINIRSLVLCSNTHTYTALQERKSSQQAGGVSKSTSRSIYNKSILSGKAVPFRIQGILSTISGSLTRPETPFYDSRL